MLLHKTGSFMRLPWFVQLWFLPVWVLLGLNKFLIRVVTFRRLAPHLGDHAGASPWLPILDKQQEHRALQISRVVRIASRYTPWNSNCFPQAVTARLLLGLYGVPYILYFGLMRDPGSPGVKAHAWAAAGRVRITGGLGSNQFTVVSCFASPCLANLLGRAH